MKQTTMFIAKCALLSASLSLLTGCVTDVFGPQPNDPRFVPALPAPYSPEPDAPGSIYRANTDAGNLYADLRAYRVGDILKVRLEENTQGSKKSSTDNSKHTTVTVPEPVLFGKNVSWLEQGVDSNTTFKGSGDSDQSNSLTGNISVTVAKVLPNGNLFINGEKWIKINTGREYIRLTGIVRPVDIEPDNSVSSVKVADPRIEYSATGQLADANKEGWLGQFFNSPIWPF